MTLCTHATTVYYCRQLLRLTAAKYERHKGRDVTQGRNNTTKMKQQVYPRILGGIGSLLPGLAAPWAVCSPLSIITAPVSAYTHIQTQDCITTDSTL